MTENDWLADRFEEHRGRLTAVAMRMLGSRAEAEDAVQETWLRLSRSDPESIDHLGAWLTTVVSRVCLNMLQARRARPEVLLGADMPEPAADVDGGSDPEYEALLADSVGLALLVVLDTLTPAERVALVLHDMFAVPFDEIAAIVGRSEPATRQLASRARRRVRYPAASPDAERFEQAEVVDAFLAAARGGDFEGLLAVLDPEVVLRADPIAVRLGATAETRGRTGVAQFTRQARGAKPALLDGAAGAVWMPGGRLRVAFRFAVANGAITSIDLIAEPDRLAELDLETPFE